MKYLFKFSVVLIFLLSNLILNATTYYVRDDGNDSNTGLSDAQAWKTISKVNSFSFAPGDDVYFKCGDTWTQATLTVDWDGTSSDYVTIGSYYGDGLIGVSGDRPIFDGEYSFPTGDYAMYAALVNIAANYVKIENISVIKSEGRGISSKQYDYIYVTNCYLFGTFMQGVIYEEVENGAIENNEFDDCARYKNEGGSNYSTSLAVVKKSKNIDIRYNKVFNTHGEGINSFNRNDGILIEYNVVCNFRSVGIYMDNSKNVIVRHNLVYNTADQTYWRTSTLPGMGIWNTVEPTDYETYNENLEIYDNLVAWCHTGLWLAQGSGASAATNVKYYNNTVIDCGTNLLVDGSLSSCEVKNNIFYKLSSTCTQTNLTGSHSGLTLSNNLWSSYVASGVLGSNSIIDEPDLYRSSGWRSLPTGDVDAEDFSLLSTSPAIGAGANLGSDYDDALNKNSVWPDFVNLLDQDNYGDWEIGGVVYASTGVSLPGESSNPSPSNGSSDISVSSTLSWTSGSDATSHDVYFGTSNPPTYVQNQTSTSYSPGTLTNNTTYYWRIDEVNSGGTTTGIVWSFTTESTSTVGNTLLHYNFSDGSGTVVTDLSGNGNNGTLVNFTSTSSGAGTFNSSEGWVTGGGLSFLDNGVGSHVETPIALNELYDGSSNKDFTIEYSANYSGASGWTAIVGTDPTSWDGTACLFLGINDLQTLNNVRVPQASAFTIGSIPWSVPDATQHHIALVFDSSENEFELFVDKESLGTSTASGINMNSSSEIIIGSTGWQLTSEKWAGIVYGIAISDTKLDTSNFVLEVDDSNTSTLPQSNNIVGHWELDNDATDASGNNYDGVWYGDGTYSTDAKVGSYSGDFTGDYSLVALPTSIGQTEMKTISFWMKKEGSNLGGADYGYAVRKQNIYFRAKDDGQLSFRAGDVFAIINSYVTNNVWIHVTGVIDGSTVKLYCNGELMQTSSGSTNLTNTTDFFGIAGYYHGNWGTFNGKIDDVIVWNVALSASEVLEVANYTGLSKTINGEIEKTEISLPNDFSVTNYPNPFNPSTNINVSIPNNGKVKVSIFNMLGEKVNELLNGELVAGTHNIMWNGKSSYGNKLSSGIYFYHVQFNKSNLVGKMILMK